MDDVITSEDVVIGCGEVTGDDISAAVFVVIADELAIAA